MYYQHDMAHCMGADCPIKIQCYRYLLHLDAVSKSDGNSYNTYLIPNSDDCSHFIDAKAYED